MWTGSGSHDISSCHITALSSVHAHYLIRSSLRLIRGGDQRRERNQACYTHTHTHTLWAATSWNWIAEVVWLLSVVAVKEKRLTWNLSSEKNFVSYIQMITLPRKRKREVVRTMPLKDVHTLISGTHKYVTLYGKRDFAVVVTNLKMWNLSWIFWEFLV